MGLQMSCFTELPDVTEKEIYFSWKINPREALLFANALAIDIILGKLSSFWKDSFPPWEWQQLLKTGVKYTICPRHLRDIKNKLCFQRKMLWNSRNRVIPRQTWYSVSILSQYLSAVCSSQLFRNLIVLFLFTLFPLYSVGKIIIKTDIFFLDYNCPFYRSLFTPRFFFF